MQQAALPTYSIDASQPDRRARALADLRDGLAGWRLAWIGGLMAAAIGLRVLSSPPFLSAQRLLVWVTSGAQAGLLLGALALYLVGAFHRRTRLRIGLGLVVLGLVLVNISPADPFFQTTRSAAPGVLTPAMTPSLRSLISTLGAWWPLLVMVYFGVRLAATARKQPDTVHTL